MPIIQGALGEADLDADRCVGRRPTQRPGARRSGTPTARHSLAAPADRRSQKARAAQSAPATRRDGRPKAPGQRDLAATQRRRSRASHPASADCPPRGDERVASAMRVLRSGPCGCGRQLGEPLVQQRLEARRELQPIVATSSAARSSRSTRSSSLRRRSSWPAQPGWGRCDRPRKAREMTTRRAASSPAAVSQIKHGRSASAGQATAPPPPPLAGEPDRNASTNASGRPAPHRTRWPKARSCTAITTGDAAARDSSAATRAPAASPRGRRAGSATSGVDPRARGRGSDVYHRQRAASEQEARAATSSAGSPPHRSPSRPPSGSGVATVRRERSRPLRRTAPAATPRRPTPPHRSRGERDDVQSCGRVRDQHKELDAATAASPSMTARSVIRRPAP